MINLAQLELCNHRINWLTMRCDICGITCEGLAFRGNLVKVKPLEFLNKDNLEDFKLWFIEGRWL